jgi:hypothetical protein
VLSAGDLGGVEAYVCDPVPALKARLLSGRELPNAASSRSSQTRLAFNPICLSSKVNPREISPNRSDNKHLRRLFAGKPAFRGGRARLTSILLGAFVEKPVAIHAFAPVLGLPSGV